MGEKGMFGEKMNYNQEINDAMEECTTDTSECTCDECDCNECGETIGGEECNQDPCKLDEKQIESEKIKELTGMLQRTQAEFDNYRKRIEKQKEEICVFANEGLIKELLGVLDNFELALSKIEGDNDFVKGVELIYGQLFEVLKSKGLQKIEAKGKKFDPEEHEALLQEESQGEKGIVLEELQKGYKINNKIIRAAKVKVSK